MKLYGHEELACIWNQLMPGLKTEPLKPENKLQKRLDKLCADASLQLPKGKRNSNKADAFMGRQLQLDANRFKLKSIKLDRNTLTLDSEDGTHETHAMGYRTWNYSPMTGYPYYSINSINRMQGFKHGFEAAAAYAWTSPTTLEVRVHYVDWISGMQFVFDFEKSVVTIVDTYPNSKPATIPFTVK